MFKLCTLLLLLLQQRLRSQSLEWSQMWNTCTFSQHPVVSSHFRRIFICFLYHFYSVFQLSSDDMRWKKKKTPSMNTWGKYLNKTHVRVFLLEKWHFLHTHLQTSLCIFSITFIENPLKQTHECALVRYQSVADHDDDVGINLHVLQECLSVFVGVF